MEKRTSAHSRTFPAEKDETHVVPWMGVAPCYVMIFVGMMIFVLHDGRHREHGERTFWVDPLYPVCPLWFV